jgi:G2/mitotic-specific cyclin 2
MDYAQDTGTTSGTGKGKEEVGLKRGRSGSTVLAQRVPLGPGRSQVAPPVANAVTARAPPVRARLSVAIGRKRPTKFISERIKEDIEVKEEEDEHVMEVETDLDDVQKYEEAIVVKEEPMLMEESEPEDEVEPSTVTKPPRIWPEFATERADRYREEVQTIRESYHDVVDMYDTTMVSEYAEEIFEYMGDLEVRFFSIPSNDFCV